MEKQFCKISIDDAEFYILTNMPYSLDELKKTSSEADHFDVFLLDGTNVYCGKVSLTDLSQMATQVDIEEERYYKTLKKCLCKGNDCTSMQFSYHLVENDDSSFKFIWKQVLDKEMKFQFGSMLLTKEENTASKILEIFSFFSLQFKVLTNEVAHLTKTNRNIEAEKEEMIKRMERYVDTKESLEKELFTKFSLVLNEKKTRIRELKKKLDGDNSESVEKCAKKKKTGNADKQEENILQSGGDTDTDEELERTPVKSKVVTKNFDEPDIILEEDINNALENTPKKNRKRVRKGKPKESPAPVLPRTSTIPRPNQSNDESTSVTKNVKPKEITEDDLLDELMF